MDDSFDPEYFPDFTSILSSESEDSDNETDENNATEYADSGRGIDIAGDNEVQGE